MTSPGSVTTWIEQLRAGNREAAQRLWDRYFPRLVGLARKRLQDLGVSRRAAGEEDVALSAFDSFYRAAEQGRFPQLGNRDELWAVLVCITARKALDLRDHERRQKRGGGRVEGESVLDGLLGSDEGAAGIAQVVGNEPTPELAAQVAEEFRRLLERLPTEELRSVAVWKLEGYTNAEIAGRLDCAEVTVERRLQVIRAVWKAYAPD
jgi:DNA-directed RNA polymerase specialized sigma24 family protein